MSQDPQAITRGTRVLHYSLEEKIGEGGMGVVWKAMDSTLDRAVAIKILPPHFAADPDRLARFEREARLLAALNHPNIATIYSIHVVEGVRYLAMELVPGEDLAQRLERGALPVAETIDIARQIAMALEAAHESGVVHRDLKPANVRITPEGRVKVLDFGLAKALENASAPPALSQSPTFVGTMASGMILGTAGYMSPEQARGQQVDRRADIWAFGVVLFEMLAGRRAFDGETISDTLAAVLRADPEMGQLPADVPAAMRRLLERCLTKDPKRRLRDIGEALLLLDDLQAGRIAEAPAAAAPAAKPGRRWPWLASMAAVALIAAAAGWALRPQPPQPLRKLTLSLDESTAPIVDATISPQGNRIAFISEGHLHVRDLGQVASRELAADVDSDFGPLWTPDGSAIVFADQDGLTRVDLASGASSPICRVPEFTGGSGATWAPNGQLLFTRGQDHIYRVNAGGGTPEVFLARVDSLEGDLHHPHTLPGGRGVLYVRHLHEGGPNRLAMVDPAGRRRDLLALSAGLMWQPVYDPRGYILFGRQGEGMGIWALPFSLARLEATGDPFLIHAGGAGVTLAANGHLAVRGGTDLTQSRVALVDTAGTVLRVLVEERSGNWSLVRSPDGRQIVVENRAGGEADLWLFDLERQSETRFAFGPVRQVEPAWLPDGQSLMFVEFPFAIWRKPADGSRPAQRLRAGFTPRPTPDGRHVIYAANGPSGTPDIWYAALDGSADSLALVETEAVEVNPMPSPSGGYLAYSSDESGRMEVYLREYPGTGGRWQVSTGGGSRAQWSLKGDRIYYHSGGTLYEVRVETEGGVRLGAPRALMDLGEIGVQSWGRYPIVPTESPDRFIALKIAAAGRKSPVDLILIENWVSEFANKSSR